MTTNSLISRQLRLRSVVPVESTIPPEMTIDGDTLLVGAAAPGFVKHPRFQLIAYSL